MLQNVELNSIDHDMQYLHGRHNLFTNVSLTETYSVEPGQGVWIV